MTYLFVPNMSAWHPRTLSPTSTMDLIWPAHHSYIVFTMLSMLLKLMQVTKQCQWWNGFPLSCVQDILICFCPTGLKYTANGQCQQHGQPSQHNYQSVSATWSTVTTQLSVHVHNTANSQCQQHGHQCQQHSQQSQQQSSGKHFWSNKNHAVKTTTKQKLTKKTKQQNNNPYRLGRKWTN